MPTGITLGDIALKQAFIEADGAFWHGGPEATTRFGTLDIDYSPYASLSKRSGISVSGIDVELAELNGFYALQGEHGHVLGMRGDLYVLDEVALGASVIKDAEITRLQMDADAAPIEGLRIRGAVAADHTDDSGLKMNNMWTVQAGYELAENTVVSAGYKHITDGFVPRYVAEQSEEEMPSTIGFTWIVPRTLASCRF